MRGMAMLLALAAAGACDGVFEPDEPVSAIVRVEDQHGRALRPDSVTWYYDPQSARYDGEHRAICLNRACTVWGVPPEVAGQAYVAAIRRRPYPGRPVLQLLGLRRRPHRRLPGQSGHHHAAGEHRGRGVRIAANRTHQNQKNQPHPESAE